MTIFLHRGRHRIAVLVRDAVMPMELGLVHQLFGRAATADGELLYEVVTCVLAPGEIRTAADFNVRVRNGPGALVEADTVVVPASRGDEQIDADGLDEQLAVALRHIRPGTRIASICTGAFVLAAAGLLDGRPATTHWRSCARFRTLYPGVDLDPDVLYTDDGDVLTSAGEASGVDLCLHMIRTDHGAAVANDVARATVVAPHRDGGQAQYVQGPVPDPGWASTVRARAWALEHLDQVISLRELAAQEAMSTRTFTRRFRDEVGTSPLQWLTRQRIERARDLLETTDLSVEQVAADAGFGTAASLRQHVRTAIGTSPSAYRRTFRR